MNNDRKVEQGWFLGSRLWHRLALALIMLASLAIRLYKIDEAPHNFWTLRQYSPPTLVRAWYWMATADPDSWQRRIAEAHVHGAQRAEPPIMETVALGLYHLTGKVSFWALRITPVLAWWVGGWLLYLIMRRITDPLSALFALLFHQGWPYGLMVSRSLQPDSLMVTMMLAAHLAILRYVESRTRARWWTAAMVSALAVWVKPGLTQPSILLVYGFGLWQAIGFKTLFRRLGSYGFAFMVILPSVAQSILESLAGRDLGIYFRYDFQPNLVVQWYFWKGWAGILLHLFGVAGLVLGGLGLVRWISSRSSAWYPFAHGVGYLATSFITIVATASHDYRHLQVLPLMCMGMGMAVPWLAGWEPLRRWRWHLPALFLVGAALFFGSRHVPWHNRTAGPYQAICEEIGRQVNHSLRCVYLDYDWGMSLRYFAGIDGHYWPELRALAFHQRVGVGREQAMNDSMLDAAERFARYYAPHDPEYFILLRAFPELDTQPGLRAFLSRFPVVARGPRYIIYRLGTHAPVPPATSP